MNVLSLFDGMSCGRIALERSGITVDKYFASEIEPKAIKISQKNYPDIIQLGDITKLSGDGLPNIDLLLAGSPCQGFSTAGQMTGLEHEGSKLFYDFVRLKDKLKPKYWLLENVHMTEPNMDIINQLLGCRPVSINSRLVSAHNRPRLYWTNIPFSGMPNDKGLVWKDIEQTDVDYVYYNRPAGKRMFHNERNRFKYATMEKSPTLLKRSTGTDCNGIIMDDNPDNPLIRKYTAIECERLQTVPDNYTEGITFNQRCEMLGNGWTVDVIVHLLKGLKGDDHPMARFFK